MPTTAALTTKQARFVQEYLLDGCGAQAAIRAGYSPHSAREIASENLTKPAVVAVLRERQAQVSAGLEITREGVIRGFLEAFEMAKIDRNPAVMVSAAASLAKVMGYLAVQTKRVEVSTEGRGMMRRLECLSDAECPLQDSLAVRDCTQHPAQSARREGGCQWLAWRQDDP